MTVSPAWPQDGNDPPRDVASGVDSSDSYRSPALPPTLFKLPRLPVSQEPVAPPQSASSHDAQPQPDALAEMAQPQRDFQGQLDAPPIQAAAPQPLPIPPQTPDPQVLSPPVVVHQTPVEPEKSESPNSDDVPPMPPAVATTTTTPIRRASMADKPTGRSWMEAIGSHGAVVVLLLVVVAAALVTGRNSRNQDENSSLADSDLLNFDEGTQIELPIPVHGSESSSGFAASDEAEPAAADQDPAVSAIEGNADSVDSVVASDPSGETPPGQSETRIPTEPFTPWGESSTQAPTESIVTLDAPRASSSPVDTQLAEMNANRIEANRVQVNEYVDRTANVDMFPASSRVPSQDTEFTFPSLEDLADDEPISSTDNQPNATSTPAGKPRFSKTPVGIKDVLIENISQYLPPDADATDAVIPTTSE